MKKTPLDEWAAPKLGAGESGLTRELIDNYQLGKLRDTIRLAYSHSPFYRALLRGRGEEGLACLDDLRRFPFTTAEDLRRHGPRFLCVSQSEISRVVTLDSSGTTGAAKRLYFTPADQELTVDFFRHGMAALTGPGDRVLILLPGERPGGVGDLLATALRRLGAAPIPHGVVRSIPETLAVLAREAPAVLVGVPVQVLALARWAHAAGKNIFRPRSVLLSTDHVPAAIVAELTSLWGCEVFEHYGLTELGLGGGTDCAAHAGYHLHEADFHFEIVDPATGEALPAGREGEVVITTLTRRGMPLIRYRTGDISRILPEPCACGSALRRLARLTRRVDGHITLRGGRPLTLAALDEAVFAVDGVINYEAAVDRAREALRLTIAAVTAGQPDDGIEAGLYRALDSVPAIRQAGDMTVTVRVEGCGGLLAPTAAKRAIAELKEADG